MVYEWFSGFKGADVHLVSVFSDDPVHQPHLWPHDPALNTSDIYTSTVSTSTIYTVSTDQVVEVAEDVDAEQRGAHRQDVEVELVVGQHAHVPD